MFNRRCDACGPSSRGVSACATDEFPRNYPTPPLARSVFALLLFCSLQTFLHLLDGFLIEKKKAQQKASISCHSSEIEKKSIERRAAQSSLIANSARNLMLLIINRKSENSFMSRGSFPFENRCENFHQKGFYENYFFFLRQARKRTGETSEGERNTDYFDGIGTEQGEILIRIVIGLEM
jgi:hypothetical protein